MPAEAIYWEALQEAPLSLDAECSRHFAWRELLVCGPTASRLKSAGEPIDPPRELKTWQMVAGLAQQILDPLVDEFDVLDLTYGFAASALTRHIKGGIAPHLDQHAGHELGKRGRPICRRGGAAVDFRVRGRSSREIVMWIVSNVPYDRIYFYGSARPVHVSWQPNPTGQAWSMVKGPSGRRIPRPFSLGEGNT